MSLFERKKVYKICVSILLILALLAVIAVGFVSKGFTDWSKFNHSEQQDLPLDENGKVTDGNGTELESGKVYPMSSKMLFTSPSAESAAASEGVTLRATITPANASNQSVDWSCVWVNASSAWATGKSVGNYMQITPVSDGSLTARVECLKAFGEQITICVLSQDNPNAKAECTVDYVKRVTNIQLKVPKSSMSDDLGFDTSVTPPPWSLKLYSNVGSTGPSAMTVTPVYSAGTISDTVTSTVTLSFTENFISNAKAYNGTEIKQVSLLITTFENATSGIKKLFGNGVFDNVTIYNKLVSALGFFPNALTFTVRTSGEYNDFTRKIEVGVNTSAMKILVESLALEDNGLVF